MKTVFIAVLVLLFGVFQSPELLAKDAKEVRAQADQYYEDLNYKKAYKLYFKLAKAGDRYSQRRVSDMYAKGEGKKVDMTEAYAWAALAAEGKEEKLAGINQEILPLTEKPETAEAKAAKLLKKYGRVAQRERIARMQRKSVLEHGSCTGSKLACPSR